MYSRHAIAFGYAWYALLWGPSSYSARLNRIGVRLGCGARLESEDEDVKAVYGAIVRREHAILVGFDRLSRRAKGRLGRLSWPGTRNMPRGERAWVDSIGLGAAVASYVGAV